MANVPKTHDNREVSQFLADYWSASDLAENLPQADDVLSGVLALKTEGDTATRSLSRFTLFTVLQSCETIDVASIEEVTLGRYGASTLCRYAAAARVASKALAAIIRRLPANEKLGGLKKAQRDLDTSYRTELETVGLC
jgi:hypothetical protein